MSPAQSDSVRDSHTTFLTTPRCTCARRETSERSRELEYREYNERHDGKPSLFPARMVHEGLLVLRYRITLRSVTYPQAGIFIGSQREAPDVNRALGIDTTNLIAGL